MFIFPLVEGNPETKISIFFTADPGSRIIGSRLVLSFPEMREGRLLLAEAFSLTAFFPILFTLPLFISFLTFYPSNYFVITRTNESSLFRESAGTYRLSYFGDSKPLIGSITSFTGTSGSFTVA
jgi:hypothetical protein